MGNSRLESIQSELRKLENLDNDLETLGRQGGGVRPRELRRVAESLGFADKKKRRGEPVMQGPFGKTVSISNHPAALGKGLGIKIIKELREVIFLIQEQLSDERDLIQIQRSQIKYWNEYENKDSK